VCIYICIIYPMSHVYIYVHIYISSIPIVDAWGIHFQTPSSKRLCSSSKLFSSLRRDSPSISVQDFNGKGWVKTYFYIDFLG
jgi:hypothetical protein